MNITLTLGEIKLTMPPEKASNIMKLAFQYAGGQEPSQQTSVSRRKQKRYKGFLVIRCEHCGEVKAFCSKNQISEYICKCGHAMELQGLKPLRLECKCGCNFFYKTNLTEKSLTLPCLHCGGPVDLTLNKRGTAYASLS